MATPFMNLDLPSPLVTLGPAWASMLNTALEVIDAHDHTNGSGSPIRAAALDIDADVDFQGHAADNLLRAGLTNRDAADTTPVSVYSFGGELYYTDASGNQVQLTVSGSPAGGSGSIDGLVSPAKAYYNSSTKVFQWSQNAILRAGLDAASLILRQAGGVGAPTITVAAPTSGVTSYTFTLPPTVPAAGTTRLLGAGTSGVTSWIGPDASTVEVSGTTLRVKDAGIVTAKIADSAVTTAKIAASAVTTAKIAGLAVTTTELGNLAVTTAKIADANVTTAKIADANVTTAKVAALAITEPLLAALSVSTGKVVDLAITEAKLAALSVSTGKVVDLAITEAKLASSAVATAKIATAAVTTAKIADANVTTAKIADNAVTRAKIVDRAINLTQKSYSTRASRSASGNVYSYSGTVTIIDQSGSRLSCDADSQGLLHFSVGPYLDGSESRFYMIGEDGYTTTGIVTLEICSVPIGGGVLTVRRSFVWAVYSSPTENENRFMTIPFFSSYYVVSEPGEYFLRLKCDLNTNGPTDANNTIRYENVGVALFFG